MNIFFSYIRDYIKNTQGPIWYFCLAYVALIIFLNYRFGIESKFLSTIPDRTLRFGGYYLLYLAAFSIPYLVLILLKTKSVSDWPLLLLLIVVAPAIFALKVCFGGLTQLIQQNINGIWGRYIAIISNLPSRLVLVILPLLAVWWLGKYDRPIFGITNNNFYWKPYLIMLLVMLPVICWASTQHDFLQTYPKLRQVYFISTHTNNSWLYKLLFEISYGIDFITIELFFRGFLVLAFVRFAGQDAILPMAVFYCSIHFGKPLAECISSFFGGLFLGIIVYRTGSITGGLIVHLGIAWMMEAGGYVGNLLKSTR
ncbi:MAG: CPBP family intramembrane glutamic endopeptidase [Chitinophagaceae bacterium]